MRAPHRIRRQRWQVGAPDLDTAFAVRQRLRRELDGTLLPAFEKAFDALADGDEVIHIPKLELRLTVGDLDELAAVLPAAIEQALAQALPKAEPHGAAGAALHGLHPATIEGQAARHSTAAEHLAMLLHYLANGNLGWAHAAGAAPEAASVLRRTAAEWATDWENVRHAAPPEPTAAFAFFFRLLQLLEESVAARLVAAAASATGPAPRAPGHSMTIRARGPNLPPESAIPAQHWRLCRQAARLALAAAAAAPDAAAWAALTADLGDEDAYNLPEHLPPPDGEKAPPGLQAPAPQTVADAPAMTVRSDAEARSPGTVTTEPPAAMASEEEAPVASPAPDPLARAGKDGPPDTEPPTAGTQPGRRRLPSSHEGDDGLPPGGSKDTPPPAAPAADALASAHGRKQPARTAGVARAAPQPEASAPTQAHARPWPPESPPCEADAPARRVYAAGLVLLHPFLALLFRERALLADGEDCLPAASLPRAAALLHWLATGRDAPYEFELGCIKVLLGLAPADPLPVAEGLLDEADRAECTALLGSALRHWSALGSTSIDGLRLSFLQRQGLLHNGETGWQLQLEPEPFDMLLARLPWGIGIVRLPWMTRPIFTDWPTP